MNELKTFFLLLFLSKTVVLTPNPISVNSEEVIINLHENISAITTGAELQIDVTAMIDLGTKSDVVQIRKVAEAKFPNKTIYATLLNSAGSMVPLTYRGGILVNDDRVRLSLEGDVPVEIEWNKIALKSDVELSEVTAIWVNAKH